MPTNPRGGLFFSATALTAVTGQSHATVLLVSCCRHVSFLCLFCVLIAIPAPVELSQKLWDPDVGCHQTLFLLLFFVHFRPNFTSHSLPYFSPLCLLPLCFSRSQTDDKNMIRLVQLVTEQLVYWTTEISKQSCCGSSSPGSCTGTSSTATECCHHSKFRTSQTWSTSRSASTT